ncbi:MAG TPA: hypothetical protein VII76_14775 [Acidimicrobiales bacterium]
MTEPSNEPSVEPSEARLERLLPMLVWVGDHEVVQTLRGLSEEELKQQSVAVRTAIHALRRKRDPTAFLTQPQYRSTVPLIADAVSVACQDAIVAALGDSADEPDRPQLLAALEEVGDKFPVSTVALTLAYVSVTTMPAADLCDELLGSDERFTPPGSAPVPD